MEYEELGLLISAGIFLGALFIIVFFILCWWVIWKKAGHSYPLLLAILMAIPPVNIVLWFIFVFGSWPVIEEVEKFRLRTVPK